MKERQTKIGSVCSDFDTFQLKSVLVKNDAGDWGSEPDDNAIGVIRSTNFNNDGKLDLSDIAYRTLSKRKFDEKKLFANDILIERSGGSETQPVGRVGFITDEIAETDYAFANFIQRISLNKNVNADVKQIDTNVRDAIAAFVKDAPQFDDTTMLTFRYNGKKVDR